jgi:polyphosphate kinase
LRLEIAAGLDALLADTRLAWELDSDGVWQRREPASGKRALSAQEALMANATKRTKKSR